MSPTRVVSNRDKRTQAADGLEHSNRQKVPAPSFINYDSGLSLSLLAGKKSCQTEIFIGSQLLSSSVKIYFEASIFVTNISFEKLLVYNSLKWWFFGGSCRTRLG